MGEQIISYRTSTRAKKGTWRKDSMLEAKRGANFSKSKVGGASRDSTGLGALEEGLISS